MILLLILVLQGTAFADQEKIRIQHQFSRTTQFGEFTDALYFTPEEYELTSKETINALKDERVNAYLNAVQNAPAPVEPSKSELEAERADLQARIAVLDTQIQDMG